MLSAPLGSIPRGRAVATCGPSGSDEQPRVSTDARRRASSRSAGGLCPLTEEIYRDYRVRNGLAAGGEWIRTFRSAVDEQQFRGFVRVGADLPAHRSSEQLPTVGALSAELTDPNGYRERFLYWSLAGSGVAICQPCRPMARPGRKPLFHRRAMFFVVRGFRRFANADRCLARCSQRFGKLTRYFDHREILPWC